jgi:outer membrane receptor protein involved in Fe transport
MSAAQVGNVEDIVSGQINGFFGTDLNALPAPEQADTLTVGLVWTPTFGGDTFKNWIFSVDYYDIKIEDVIGEFAAQEVLDGCYVAGQADQCDKVRRVGGTLTLPGSGIELFTTNLDYLQAEGVEVGFSFGVDMGDLGDLTISGNYNKYLTQESQSSALTPVLDCLGFYGTSCGGPLPEDRWIQRTTWSVGMFDLSYLWRHTGSVEIEDVQKATTYEEFRQIDSYDYIDLYASVNLWENVRVSLGVQNVTEEDPPVVGNEAADTRSNSGNTFPSHYDPLGRVYTVGLNVSF